MNGTLRVIDDIFGDSNRNWVQLRNKICYSIGMSYLFASLYIIGRAPCYYEKFSGISSIVLLVLRVFQYTSKNFHLYLIDFCYFGNLILIITSLGYTSKELMTINHSFSTIMLAGVLTFSNSLVPHSLQHFTTCFIHLNPAIVIYVSQSNNCHEYECDLKDSLETSFKYYFYFLIFYYSMIFGLLKNYWQKNNIQNLYTYWKAVPLIAGIIRPFPEILHPFAITGIYIFCYFWLIILDYFFCISSEFYTVLVLSITLYAIYRSGNYYIEYLPKSTINRKNT